MKRIKKVLAAIALFLVITAGFAACHSNYSFDVCRASQNKSLQLSELQLTNWGAGKGGTSRCRGWRPGSYTCWYAYNDTHNPFNIRTCATWT